MSTIVDSGEARNLTSVPTRDGLVPDPTAHKFVTFINDVGGVHTIIVDVEHAAKDAGELLRWFEHTKAAVTLTHGDPSSSLFKTADEVISIADKALGWADKAMEGSTQSEPSATTDGSY